MFCFLQAWVKRETTEDSEVEGPMWQHNQSESTVSTKPQGHQQCFVLPDRWQTAALTTKTHRVIETQEATELHLNSSVLIPNLHRSVQLQKKKKNQIKAAQLWWIFLRSRSIVYIVREKMVEISGRRWWRLMDSGGLELMLMWCNSGESKNPGWLIAVVNEADKRGMWRFSIASVATVADSNSTMMRQTTHRKKTPGAHLLWFPRWEINRCKICRFWYCPFCLRVLQVGLVPALQESLQNDDQSAKGTRLKLNTLNCKTFTTTSSLQFWHDTGLALKGRPFSVLQSIDWV